MPRPDSPSVFAAILDRAAGSFRFGPSGVGVPAGRRYLPGTLVLETTWRTRTGWLIVRDALCIGPWYHSQRRSGTHRRPPTDQEAEHILLRTARCVVGSVEVSLDCSPVFDYGQTAASWEYSGTGYGEAIARAAKRRAAATGHRPQGRLRRARRARDEDVEAGREGLRGAVLARSQYSASKELLGGASAPGQRRRGFRAHRADGRLLARVDQPRGVSRASVAELPAAQRAHAQRPDLQPHRGVLAAATTSLPETIGGERNWDYRYTWIRDGTFMLWGLYTLGFAREANDFFYFIADVAAGKKDLQIMYGIGGEHELAERRWST